MIDIKNFCKNKSVPDWFKEHQAIKEVKTVKKIFPSIGLDNFTINTDITYTSDLENAIFNLSNDLILQIRGAKYYLLDKKKEPSSKLFDPIIDILSQLEKQFYSKSLIDIYKRDKKLCLSTSIKNIGGEIFAKEKESLFKVYKKLQYFLNHHYGYKCQDLENLYGFRDYSACNIISAPQVVFSSDGEEGAWDILTMSMRGITSCQKWDGEYKKCLIGSVLDPYTAIIYLTSGSKTPYGSKMIRRCIVRFIVNEFNNRPYLFLDRMYPTYDKTILDAFENAIRSKIGSKFEIISNLKNKSYYIPTGPASKILANHSNLSNLNYSGSHNFNVIFPYRDTFIKIKTNDDNQLYLNDFRERFATDLKIAQFKKIPNISAHFSNKIIEYVQKGVAENDIQNYVSKNEYIKERCKNYFLCKRQLRDFLLKSLKKELKAQKCKTITILMSNANEETENKDISSIVDNIILPETYKIIADYWRKAVRLKKTRTRKPKLKV